MAASPAILRRWSLLVLAAAAVVGVSPETQKEEHVSRCQLFISREDHSSQTVIVNMEADFDPTSLWPSLFLKEITLRCYQIPAEIDRARPSQG
uniref:Secreted protein n=1 Tax=Ixodes ricinus TaxID=34613 RepID=A0A0K8RDP1_IXORI